MDLEQTSRYMSMLLRHKPEKENLILDSQGYTDVDKLLTVLKIDKKTLDEIVRTDNKNRYSYDVTGTKIRANQGHSVSNVHIDFKTFNPSENLYHGTATKFLDSILKTGLISKTRQYVHLSKDIETATNVGLRHAKSKTNLVIFEVDVNAMTKDGYKFFISENDVPLTEKVPVKYLKRIV